MADGWSAFPSNNLPQQTGDDEDEWADFGGFESASPAANPFTESPPAFPWATAFPAQQTNGFAVPHPAHNASVPAQHNQIISGEAATPATLPTFTPTSQSSVTQQHTATALPTQTTPTAQPSTTLQTPSPMSQHTSISQPDTNNLFILRTVETISEAPPPLPSRTDLVDPFTLTTNQMQSGDTAVVRPQDTYSNQLAAQAPPDVTSLNRMSDYVSVVRPHDPHSSKLTEIQQKLEDSEQKNADYSDKIKQSEEKLSLAEREKLLLQQDIEIMKKDLKEREDLCKEQFLEIEKQKEKYDELQMKHQEQIKGLREAGHESLAVIVEEYKELVKTSVVQQQEQNEKHLHEALAEEREKFTMFLDQQNENMKLMLKEEQEKNVKNMENVLEKTKTDHQVEIQNCVDEERLRGQEALQKTVEEEREHSKLRIQQLLNEQSEQFEAFLEDQKKIFEETKEEERRNCAKLVEKALEDEQDKNKKAIEEVLVIERQNSREAVSVTKEKTKKEMNMYVKEKEKADDVTRQRVYQSMDLFLRGVQTQLNSLLNPDDKDQRPTS